MSTFQTDIMFKQFDRCYKHCGTSNFIRIYWIFLQNWTAIYKPANIDILVIIRRKTNVSYNRYLYLKRINKKLKEKKWVNVQALKWVLLIWTCSLMNYIGMNQGSNNVIHLANWNLHGIGIKRSLLGFFNKKFTKRG